jgi:hypothetical protein
MCAVKAGAFQQEVVLPGNWFVPPGNNRSGGGGNKVVGAFDAKSCLSSSVSMQVVTRVNTEQTSKHLMQEPTRRSDGEGRRRWRSTSEQLPSDLPGYW